MTQVTEKAVTVREDVMREERRVMPFMDIEFSVGLTLVYVYYDGAYELGEHAIIIDIDGSKYRIAAPNDLEDVYIGGWDRIVEEVFSLQEEEGFTGVGWLFELFNLVYSLGYDAGRD